jgi:sec-independent protein translocase protein TatA
MGQMELVIFLVIVLLLFGSRLPSAMFSVGKSIKEFKKGINETDDDTNLTNDKEQTKT